MSIYMAQRKLTPVADDRIREWASGLLEAYVRAFERARVRFLRRPATERLHDVRVSARRLRSLCEDLRDALPPVHGRRLHRLIAMTGDARDAAVLREALRNALDVRERQAAKPLMRALRERERTVLQRIARTLKRFKLRLT
jgi:CHAD domain-containing protein